MYHYTLKTNNNLSQQYTAEIGKRCVSPEMENAVRQFLSKHSCSLDAYSSLDELLKFYDLESATELSSEQLSEIKAKVYIESINKAAESYSDLTSQPLSKNDIKVKTAKNEKGIGELHPETNAFFLKERQIFANPFGIDAMYSWSVPGGDGKNSSLYLLDYGIEQNKDLDGAVNIISNPTPDSHGTSTMGIIKMLDNDELGIGIAPNAEAYFYPYQSPQYPSKFVESFLLSLNYLEPGDVINCSFQTEAGPLVTVPLAHATFKFLTDAGIVLVIIAGNKTNNLDNITDENGKYILNVNSPDYVDSGAIIAGGCLARTDLPRALNFGSIVDTMAFCEDVFSTAGTYYMYFGGTSAAAPIISGVILNIQSALREAGRPPLRPHEVKALLRDHNNGQPSSTVYPGEHLSLPSLRKIFNNLGLPEGGYDSNYGVSTAELDEMSSKVDALFTDKSHTVLKPDVSAKDIAQVNDYLTAAAYCEIKLNLIKELSDAYDILFSSAETILPPESITDISQWTFTQHDSIEVTSDGIDIHCNLSPRVYSIGFSYNKSLQLKANERYRVIVNFRVKSWAGVSTRLAFGAVSIENGEVLDPQLGISFTFSNYHMASDQQLFIDYIPDIDRTMESMPAFYLDTGIEKKEIVLNIKDISIIRY